MKEKACLPTKVELKRTSQGGKQVGNHWMDTLWAEAKMDWASVNTVQGEVSDEPTPSISGTPPWPHL